MYDIIIQNNATKEITLVSGQTNVSTSHLYLQFDNVELDLPDGEYTIVALVNNRDDVEYEFTTPILDTMVKTEEGDVKLKYLNPNIHIMRIGKVEQINKYDKTNVIFYYEG